MLMVYFIVWIILCVLAGVGIGLLRGNIRLGITLIPLFLSGYAYVCCYEIFSVVLIILFLVLLIINAKQIWRIRRKREQRKKHPKLWVSIPGTVLILAIVIVFLISNAVVSALLMPEFMKKLEAFQKVTEKSYNELVQTSDIQRNHDAAIAATNQWLKTVSYEMQSIQTSDGYTLNSIMFYPEERTMIENNKEHKWVLLAHGYTGWKEEMFPFAYWYSLQGYTCVVPDCRASGSSEGDYIGMGYLDSQDMLGWIDKILEIDPEAKIVLHGQSMGGATVLMMSGMEDLPECVVGVVSDCAYSDAFEMFQLKGRDWLGLDSMPDFALEIACFTFRLRGGYDFHKASPIQSVINSRIPILYIHGDMDRMVPVSMANDLYNATSTYKDILIVQGAGHAQSQDKDPEGYYNKIDSFLSVIE